MLVNDSSVDYLSVALILSQKANFTIRFGELSPIPPRDSSQGLPRRGFVILVVLNVSGLVPEAVKAPLSTVSTVCVLAAVVAMGVRTNLINLKLAGMTPIVIMTAATIFLLVWMAGGTALLA